MIYRIQSALISVFSKEGLEPLLTELHNHGVAFYSTGGTQKFIEDAGFPCTSIESVTGYPSILDGRVKTLHPKVFGGILAKKEDNSHQEQMKEYDLPSFDMVVVDLYPFAETVSAGGTESEIIEKIDIGGISLIRAAAKNFNYSTIVSHRSQYPKVLEMIQKQGVELNLESRKSLATEAFYVTQEYDNQINRWFTGQKTYTLRYGENPHQSAAFYKENNITEACVASSTQSQGKEMSFNNMADADAALECVRSFDEPACVIVKHANPCGVAVRANIFNAYDDAFKTDPTSAFGGIIAFNRNLDKQTAQAIIDRQFVEVIIAPSVDDDAKAALSTKKNVRVLECGNLSKAKPSLDYKRVTGGLLVQDKDLGVISENDIKCVSDIQPTAEQIKDLLFAWKVAKTVKSNAIVYVKNEMTIGVGAGQMSRVYSAKIAGIKAADEGLVVEGSVMASDAFFPFRDGIDAAAAAGIKAIIQPGGSMRDDEVIAAANEHGIAMVFTGMRHFKH